MARGGTGRDRGAAAGPAARKGSGGFRGARQGAFGPDQGLPRGGGGVAVREGELSGKTALVIGASSGIGLAVANLFAEAGATVHAAARRREAIEDGAGGRRVVADALDISEKEAVWRLVEEVGEADGIDVLVGAGGVN